MDVGIIDLSDLGFILGVKEVALIRVEPFSECARVEGAGVGEQIVLDQGLDGWWEGGAPFCVLVFVVSDSYDKLEEFESVEVSFGPDGRGFVSIDGNKSKVDVWIGAFCLAFCEVAPFRVLTGLKIAHDGVAAICGFKVINFLELWVVVKKHFFDFLQIVFVVSRNNFCNFGGVKVILKHVFEVFNWVGFPVSKDWGFKNEFVVGFWRVIKVCKSFLDQGPVSLFDEDIVHENIGVFKRFDLVSGAEKENFLGSHKVEIVETFG